VVLLGGLPAFRSLAVNVKGPDVRQFEENLRALGYHGFTVDSVFDAATVTAVKKWQKDLGLAETGTLELGRVVYVAAPVRVAALKQHVGDQAAPGTAVLTVTGMTRSVSVELDDKTAPLGKVGVKVQVSTAGGKSVGGVMTAVAAGQGGQDDAQGAQGQQAKTVVTVTVAQQSALSGGDGDPVDVVVVRAQKKNVLTVPIVALLAVGDGYGLETYTGGRRIVPVTVGIFAQGRAEVSGPGLVEGMRVGVAGE